MSSDRGSISVTEKTTAASRLSLYQRDPSKDEPSAFDLAGTVNFPWLNKVTPALLALENIKTADPELYKHVCSRLYDGER